MLAGQDSLGDLHIQHTLLGYQAAVRIDFRHAQGELARAAAQSGVEIEQHLGVMVFAASGVECAAPVAGSRPSLRAEQRLEEVAVGGVARARAGKLKPRAPIRRWPEILTRMPLAELIVGGALVGTLEHFVRFADLLEARFGVLFLADVRMIFASELAVGLLDLRLRGIARHAHDLVVVLVLHRTRKPSNGEAGKDTMRRARRINNPV